MKKIYIFPIFNEGNTNSYTSQLAESLNKRNIVLNINQIKSSLLSDLFRYFSADVFIFNWVENIALENRRKYIRIFVYISMTILYRLVGKKIIWILHNKCPHERQSSLSSFLMKYNSKIASYIFTHSKTGIEFCKENYSVGNKVFFLHHPIYKESILFERREEKQYDIIIWGSIKKYKKILEFVTFWIEEQLYKKFKLLICGKCDDPHYDYLIKEKIEGTDVVYVNEYITTIRLNELISSSKAVLFTYNNDSVLSSGALIYSIPFFKKIIGPDHGIFKQLKEEGIVQVYNSFYDIEELLLEEHYNDDAIEQFVQNNNWQNFALAIENIITL